MYTLLLSCLIKLEARRFNCHNLYPSLKRNRCEKEIHVYMYKRVSLLIKKSNENRFCYVINIITFRYTIELHRIEAMTNLGTKSVICTCFEKYC